MLLEGRKQFVMGLVSELRRRNVFRVAIAYVIIAWLVLQVGDTLAPALRLDEWVNTALAFFLILGFPIAVFFAWAYELTPEGIKLEQHVDRSQSITHLTGRKLDYVIIAVLSIALVYLAFDKIVLDASRDAELVQTTTEVVTEQAAESPAPVFQEKKRDVLQNSIAVLPFDNLSPDPANAYFAAGIHESTLSQLAKIRDLSVIARTSVMQYRDSPPPIPIIAEALNVEMVMEGSVRYASGRVLITAQLVNGQSGATVWSAEYNRDLADIFAVQAEIAERIAGALEAELTPGERESIERPPTSSAAAYHAYLRSLDVALPDAVVHQYLDQAIGLDPAFALAYARQGYFYARDLIETAQVQHEDVAKLERLVRQHAEKALELDPNLGYAYAALGRMYWSFWRQSEAQAAFEQALQLAPNDSAVLRAYAEFNFRRGENARALQMAERAVELDPKNAKSHWTLGDAHFFARNPDAAALAQLKAIELEPAFLLAHVDLALAEAMRGNNTQALQELHIAEQLGIREPPALARTAYVYAQIGRREDALRLLNQLKELAAAGGRIGPAQWALVHVAAGNTDQALEWLDIAAENRLPVGGFFITALVKENILSDPILDQPEFVYVRSRLGFRE